MGKGKCGNDCGECRQSCLNCDGNFVLWERRPSYRINVKTFKPYFDVTMGKVVESQHEINEFCKRNDMVYAGDKELSQQCKQNKQENDYNRSVQFIDGLTQELSGVLN